MTHTHPHRRLNKVHRSAGFLRKNEGFFATQKEKWLFILNFDSVCLLDYKFTLESIPTRKPAPTPQSTTELSSILPPVGHCCPGKDSEAAERTNKSCSVTNTDR